MGWYISEDTLSILVITDCTCMASDWPKQASVYIITWIWILTVSNLSISLKYSYGAHCSSSYESRSEPSGAWCLLYICIKCWIPVPQLLCLMGLSSFVTDEAIIAVKVYNWTVWILRKIRLSSFCLILQTNHQSRHVNGPLYACLSIKVNNIKEEAFTSLILQPACHCRIIIADKVHREL